jgi:hypothetical protein
MYRVATGTPLSNLAPMLANPNGPLKEHLRDTIHPVLQDEALKDALVQLLKTGEWEDTTAFYALESDGLVHKAAGAVRLRNKIYEQYLRRHFGLW